MKIAVIGLRGFPNIQGGVENHCENIISRLRHEMQWVVYRRKPYVRKQEHHKPVYNNVRFIDLPSTKVKGFETMFHTFLAVMHIILHHNVDIVNIHNIGPGVFTPLLRLFGYKVILTYHSPNYEHSKWGLITRTMLKIGERLSLRYANRVIFVNKFQMNKYSQRLKERAIYIPNGINNVTRSTETDFLQRHSITPGRYILAVGRLTPEKGFDTLIKAVNMANNIDCLVIAGSTDHNTSYLEKLKSIDSSHKVVFTGHTIGEDLRQLYSHAALYVLSSTNEGFPIVMLEAMSYGLPLIVTDISATHLIELPPHCYVNVGDIHQMAHVIQQHYDTTSAGTTLTYPQLQQYHWDNIAQLTARVYTDIH